MRFKKESEKKSAFSSTPKVIKYIIKHTQYYRSSERNIFDCVASWKFRLWIMVFFGNVRDLFIQIGLRSVFKCDAFFYHHRLVSFRFGFGCWLRFNFAQVIPFLWTVCVSFDSYVCFNQRTNGRSLIPSFICLLVCSVGRSVNDGVDGFLRISFHSTHSPDTCSFPI